MKRKMDDNGWIPIALILTFNLMKQNKVVPNIDGIECDDTKNKLRMKIWRKYFEKEDQKTDVGDIRPRPDSEQEMPLKTRNRILMKTVHDLETKLAASEMTLQMQQQEIRELLNKQIQDKQRYEVMEMKYNDLERKYQNAMRKCDEDDYKLWNVSDVVDWIIRLDFVRYNKYKQVLMQNMTAEQFDGSCLDDIEKNDLHRLGITGFKDKKDIFDRIQGLISMNNKTTPNITAIEGMQNDNNTPFM